MALEPFCQCVVCEFNPRDPSVLASGLMTGQVCNWDIRTGMKPVQSSHLLFSHRDHVNAVRWLSTKSNTEFFSASSDGCAMWWDTRQLRRPTETLLFDFENPNQPNIDRSIGVSCLNYGPMVGSKFMFGTDNGIVVSGARKMKTNAEKLAVRLEAHSGPVRSIDRNVFNPMVFLSVGDWTARVWAEDTREGCLVSTPYFLKNPTGGCWNKSRCSVFYVMTANGRLLACDLLQSLERPVFTLKLCKESLTSLAPYEEGTLLAVGNTDGNVFLVESTEFFQSFDRKDRIALSEYFERRSRVTKAVDVRLREIKLAQKIIDEEMEATRAKEKVRSLKKTGLKLKEKDREKERGRDSRSSKGKRKSASKERKKRDDSPQSLEAEQKYFEMVQKGLEVYALESDPNLRPVPQQVQARKQDRKQRKASASEDGDAEEHDRSKMKEEMRERRKSRRIRVKKRTTLKPSARVSERSMLEGSPAKSASKLVLDESERRKRRGRKPKTSFSLPVPCKGEVCKPRICCWRKGAKEGGRDRSRSRSRSRSRIEDGKAERESVEWTTTKSMKLRGKKARILREMMEPPLELTLEADRARAEIREAGLRGRPLKTRTVQRPSRIRTERTREEQKQKRGRKRDVGEKQDTKSEQKKKDEKEVQEEEGEGKRSVMVDPCNLPKAKSITEEFSTILGVPVPKTVEEKVDSKAHLDKQQLARTRVYPRLSEYHGTVE